MSIKWGTVGLGFSHAIATLTNGSTNHSYATTDPYTAIGVASSGTATITGLASPAEGEIRTFTWNGSGAITFKHNDTGSPAANRLSMPSALNVVVGSGGRKAISFIYITDPFASRWRCISSV
jgi:hypothetical protein